MRDTVPPRGQILSAIACVMLGAYPFLSGAYERRSMLWNGASVVLLLYGIYVLVSRQLAGARR